MWVEIFTNPYPYCKDATVWVWECISSHTLQARDCLSLLSLNVIYISKMTSADTCVYNVFLKGVYNKFGLRATV